MSKDIVFLTSSKHIRSQDPNQAARLTAFNPAHQPQKRDEFRNVTVSCLFGLHHPNVATIHRNPDMTKPRKDPAAHVSLSSDAIVKQQRKRENHPPRKSPIQIPQKRSAP